MSSFLSHILAKLPRITAIVQPVDRDAPVQCRFPACSRRWDFALALPPADVGASSSSWRSRASPSPAADAEGSPSPPECRRRSLDAVLEIRPCRPRTPQRGPTPPSPRRRNWRTGRVAPYLPTSSARAPCGDSAALPRFRNNVTGGATTGPPSGSLTVSSRSRAPAMGDEQSSPRHPCLYTRIKYT